MEFTDRFRINDNDYTTFPTDLADRFVEQSRVEKPGRPWPTRIGYYQWQVGDCASVHLNKSLPWTLVELRITKVIDRESYRVVIIRFDGQKKTIAGLSIGDEIAVKTGKAVRKSMRKEPTHGWMRFDRTSVWFP